MIVFSLSLIFQCNGIKRSTPSQPYKATAHTIRLVPFLRVVVHFNVNCIPVMIVVGATGLCGRVAVAVAVAVVDVVVVVFGWTKTSWKISIDG